MNPMIERVARALCTGDPDTSTNIGPLWKAWEHPARAAIAAMREPTEAMIQVQDDVRYLRDLWPAMIDAALKDD